MGTINYGHNDYFNIGVNPANYWDNDIFLDFEMDFDYNNIKSALDKYNFEYFTVTIEPGYYEGFSIDIEYNFSYCLDGWQDRRQALKEITGIYKFLLKCINDFGLVACSPGWCTSYYDYNESIKRLKQAIKEMRQAVQSTPTWAQLRRVGEI